MSFEPTTSKSGMRVVRFPMLDPLASQAGQWDRMARGVPFRSWAWASNWWRHYGDDPCRADRKTALFTLGVLDQADSLVGLAPWYAENSVAEGRVLRFLGTGEVCSDHLSVLCEPGREDLVAAALADWLSGARAGDNGRPHGRDSNRWDLLELTGVDAEDAVVRQLAEQLEARGNAVYRRAGPNCWRIELPTSWEAYLARLSKNHRKQIRRITRRMLATGRVRVHSVECLEDLPRAREVLIDLHRRRRVSLGEPGCFASSRFTAFHRDVMPDLLRSGQLRLDWLELDGEPVAAEYQLTGNGVVYAYQAGMNPDALEHSPGRMSHVAMLRQSIEQGDRALDFLRGDEPYKAHWRAEPRASLEIRVVPARAAARLRYGLRRAGASVKHWAKSGLRLVAGENPGAREEA